MKPFLLAAATLLPCLTPTAYAAELKPAQGEFYHFGGGASALIYFESRPDGYHVVTTVQSDDTAAAKVFRFVAVLAAGQSTEISVPHEVGMPADVIVVRRAGDQLIMDDGATGGRS